MVTKRKRLLNGHWNDCGIIWDWPCDCGRVEEVRKAKEGLWDLLGPFEKLHDWLKRRLA